MKKLLFLLFFILIIPLSYGIGFTDDTVIFDEPFNYSDLYTNHGYTLTKGCAFTPSSPIDETMGLNNATNYGCGVGSGFYTKKYFDVNTTTENTYKLSFDTYIGDDDRQNETIQKGTAEIGLYETGGNGILLNSNSNMTRIYIARDDVSTVKFSSIPQAENCSFLVNDGYGHIDFIIDYNTNLYYLYVDDTLKCDGLDIGVHNEGYGRIFTYLYGFGGSYPINRYIDNVYLSNGTLTDAPDTCSYPILFCDNFNYGTSMYGKGWKVYTGAYSVDLDFSPVDNKLQLVDDNFYSPFHETEAFEVYLPVAAGEYITGTPAAPAFSSEFEFNMTSGDLKYLGFSDYGKSVFDVRLRVNGSNIDVYYYDSLNTEVQVCQGCAAANKSSTLKIVSYFDDNDALSCYSMFTNNSFNIYINDTPIETQIPFRDDSAEYLSNYYIVKLDDAVYTIDDYYVYVGLDKAIDTYDSLCSPIYIPPDEETVIGTGSGDLASNIEDIWALIGIRSAVSRAILALVLIIALNGLIIVGAWKSGINVSAVPLIIINFLVLVLFVFMNLLSFWIPLVLVIIAAGIGAIIAKNQAGG